MLNSILNEMREVDEVGTVSLFPSHTLSPNQIESFESRFDTSSGGSRFVIDFGDVVLKLPRCYEVDYDLGECETLLDVYDSECEGFDQMITEWLVWEICPDDYRHLLCPILDYGFLENGVPYTVMKKARTFSDWGDDVETNVYHSGNSQIERPSYAPSKGSWYEDGVDLEEFLMRVGIDYDSWSRDEIEDLCSSCGIDECDFFNNFSNLGEIDGELVLIDYGWGLHRSMRGALNERDIEEILERQEVVY